uniref:Uncharacterized protein n=1 Tax=Glossina pallidipes TaxID=7398 RepID=A0A1B0A2K6_GLOPL
MFLQATVQKLLVIHDFILSFYSILRVVRNVIAQRKCNSQFVPLLIANILKQKDCTISSYPFKCKEHTWHAPNF